ncbi:MAG TPA: hypothetical protein VNZ58_11085 [Thermomicrobiales bacterium]|nr:hypothetical protein [Thermomicrobiales bacterium]
MNQPDRDDLPETPFDEATDIGEDRSHVGRTFHLPSWKPLLFIVAVLLSPIAGLMFGLDVALGILVVAMAFTTWMAWEGARDVPVEDAIRLRRAAMLNGAVAVAGIVLIALRQVV